MRRFLSRAAPRLFDYDTRMDSSALVAAAAMAILGVAGQMLWPTRRRRIRRALAARPAPRVNAASGEVRVAGRVRGTGELLRAPLTGRTCVAYELLVETTSSTGDRTQLRFRVVSEQRACAFLVEDESGIARVETSRSFVLDLPRDHTGSVGWLDRYPGDHGRLAEVVEAAGFQARNRFNRWRPISYGEGVLREGDFVVVGGVSDREADPMGEKPDARSPPERVVLRGSEETPLLISEGKL
jgi:hypothetical protein